jgi:hypothetical protein
MQGSAAGSGERGDLVLGLGGRGVRVAARAGRAVDDGGAGDEGAGGEKGEGSFGEHTGAESAAGGDFAEALGGDTLAGAGYPGDERRGRDGRDGGAQGGAGTVEQPAHGAVGDAEGCGNLLVAVAGEGGAEYDLALQVGEGGHVGEGVAQVQATGEVRLEHDGRVGAGDTVKVERETAAIAGGVAGEVDGGVVGDAVEPGAKLAYRGAAAQGGPGLQEGLLDDVFGAAVRDGEAPAVAQKRRAVAVDESLEGAVVSGAGHCGESLVGLGGQQAGGCLGTHAGASPMLERRTWAGAAESSKTNIRSARADGAPCGEARSGRKGQAGARREEPGARNRRGAEIVGGRPPGLAAPDLALRHPGR